MAAEKVLLDTDIGSDIDDAVCLAYLLAHRRCELLGITTVSGEPDRRAAIASAMCRAAGAEIPVVAGAAQPLLVPQRQPEAPQAAALGAGAHRTEVEPGAALELMRATVRAHPGEVTLLAIGPLTNVALLFAVDPEIPALLRSVVLMGGRYLTHDADRPAEWNMLLDPHAAAMVMRARPPSLRAVGLDVTLQVTLPADEVRARFTAPLLAPALAFAEIWFDGGAEGITFHDPLAAAAILEPDLCRFERGSIEVETHGPEAGVTRWLPGEDGPHQVATEVAARDYLDHFFAVMDAGGPGS